MGKISFESNGHPISFRYTFPSETLASCAKIKTITPVPALLFEGVEKMRGLARGCGGFLRKRYRVATGRISIGQQWNVV